MKNKKAIKSLILICSLLCTGCHGEEPVRPVKHYEAFRDETEYDLYEFQGKYILTWTEDDQVTYLEKGRIVEDEVVPEGAMQKKELEVFGEDLHPEIVMMLAQYGLDIYNEDPSVFQRPHDAYFYTPETVYYKEVINCNGSDSCYKACDQDGKCDEKKYESLEDIPVPDWYKAKTPRKFVIKTNKQQTEMGWYLAKEATDPIYDFTLTETTNDLALFDDRDVYNTDR